MRLLLIEDDRALARSLARGLGEEGFDVEVVHDGNDGLARLRAREAAVCVLDGGLPGRDGFEVLEAARADGITLPVLILTARDATEDRVRGLDLGADDYLVKPFAFAELMARLRALLRRAPAAGSGERRAGDLRLDPRERRAWRGEEELTLSAMQFDLLSFLLGRGTGVAPREEILRAVWGYDFDPGTNVVDVHIAALRHRIDRPGERSRIRTVRGVGYAMAGEDA